MEDLFEITDGFLEIVAEKGFEIDNIMYVLKDEGSRMIENRGKAANLIVGHTPQGLCIGIPIENGEQNLLRPVTVFEIKEPRVLMQEHDVRHERWERRKGWKSKD